MGASRGRDPTMTTVSRRWLFRAGARSIDPFGADELGQTRRMTG
jgi:hypothetical protein